MSRVVLGWLIVVVFSSAAAAQFKPITRRIPPQGIELPAKQKARLLDHAAEVRRRLDELRQHPLRPDAEVLVKAVEYALELGEFYNPKDVAKADDLLREANLRIADLAREQTPWTKQRGLIVRGYRSSIDGSVQPYGLEIPESLDFTLPVPLYVWLHGRGDKVTDLHFIHQRLSRPGRIAPAGAIVVHPFGRHCMGFKSAGEIDVLEVVDHVRSQYPIDRRRIALMGFSMGGTGAWHVGAHYADRWVALSPGAGFAETARYNRIAAKDFPPQIEQTMWGLYDVPGYVRNLFNLPVVAYSGEIDKQIQAARVMEEAFAQEGRKLPHLIGPKTAHRYHPQTLAELMAKMEGFVADGQPTLPKQVHLQTRTLRYHRMHWVDVRRLEQHWKDSRVDAEIVGDRALRVATRNVQALRLNPWDPMQGVSIEIDGQSLKVGDTGSARHATLVKGADGWQWTAQLETPKPSAPQPSAPKPSAPKSSAPKPSAPGLVKRPGLQGPIDDAFMEPFLVVTPTQFTTHPEVDLWTKFELKRLRNRWMALYRAKLPEKPDRDITDADMLRYHLVVFGDPQSNLILKRTVSKLPVEWGPEQVVLGKHRGPVRTTVALLIYPNPLQPRRYLVVNSGPTFREGHDRTNSLQNPKLGDWALIDLLEPPGELTPGRVLASGLFDERWQ